MNNDLEKMRHSASHLLAHSVMELYPNTKLGIGPAIDDGFYYDFEFADPISVQDLEKIQAKMEGLKGQDLRFSSSNLPIKEAKEEMAGQPYKLELIEDLEKTGQQEVTFYQSGDFIDLCKGPHLNSYKEIGIFKLDRLAGAYWKGSEKNQMLTRIYGLAFMKQKDLDEYLQKREEALTKDHRELNKKLDYFSQNEQVGTGLILWHPNLSVVREEIELYWRREHRKRGYQYLYTPHIGKRDLWDRSGHTDHYKNLMFPSLKDDREEEYFLKPMSCPFHIMIYNSRPRSYKDLPLRWCELGTVYRYELEGVRHGILRPRGFTQDDAHIICAPESVVEELEGVLDFAIEINRVFGFEKLHYELSLRDPSAPSKYIGESDAWDIGEKTLKKILDGRKVEYKIGIGEAKFYGPAIDLKVEDAMGRLWQGTTIQFDFNLPERFNMTYIGANGKEYRPFMVHRTVLGSMERFIGTLIENYGGAFPVWLSPVQVTVIPISQEQTPYAEEAAKQIRTVEQLSGPIRVTVDNRDETMQNKIRHAQEQKIPYMLVVGKREQAENTVNVRLRTEQSLGAVSLEKFIEHLKEKIETKSFDL